MGWSWAGTGKEQGRSLERARLEYSRSRAEAVRGKLKEQGRSRARAGLEKDSRETIPNSL